MLGEQLDTRHQTAEADSGHDANQLAVQTSYRTMLPQPKVRVFAVWETHGFQVLAQLFQVIFEVARRTRGHFGEGAWVGSHDRERESVCVEGRVWEETTKTKTT